MAMARGLAAHSVRGGWHRPVSLRALLVVGVGLLGVWLVVMLGVGWFVYTQLDLRMVLRDQPAMLRLPAGLRAQAQVAQPVRTEIALQAQVKVPVRQSLAAQVDDSLLVQAGLDASLAVDTVVAVDQVVPVSTELRMQVPVFSWLPAFDVRVPVSLHLPFKAQVPVRTQVPVHLDALFSAELRAPIVAPIDEVFRLRPQVWGEVRAQILGQMDFALSAALPPMPMTIERAGVRMPLDAPRIDKRQSRAP